MLKCLKLAHFDDVTTMYAVAKHGVVNYRQGGGRDPLEFFMKVINLRDISEPVMNRNNDIGESVIQIGVVKVYYASPTVYQDARRGGIERQPCTIPIHVSVQSHE